jgi:exonuclease SbcC
MRPLSLHLENVRTFDRLDFDFPDGCCAIVGPNGSGKSTTVSALDVALFGAESRSLADWLSKDRPEATMTISLTFGHGIHEYRVRRTFSGKGRGTTRVDFEEGDGGELQDGSWVPSSDWRPLTRESASATQEEIERIIGLTRETFRASAFLAQGQGGVFCEATPGKRKEILAAVLGLDVWDGYRERARAELRSAEQALAVVRAKIEAAEVEISGRLALAESLATAKEREQVARTALTDCGSQLAKARERLSKLREAAGLREAAERAVASAQDAVTGILDRIAALEQEIRQAEVRLAEREGLETLAAGLPGLEREQAEIEEQRQGWAWRGSLLAQHDRLVREQRVARQNALDLEDRALRVLADNGEPCDRCGQPLHAEAMERAAESYREEAKAFDARASDLSTGELSDLTAKIAELPRDAPDEERSARVHDLINQGRHARAKLLALAELAASRDRMNEELQKVRAELPEREETATAARAELEALGPCDPDALAADERHVANFTRDERTFAVAVEQAASEVARLDERLQRLDFIGREARDLRFERGVLESEVELLSHLERACGPNGVPALILETSAIPQLEAEWNRLLRLLPTDSGDLFEVELHTQRERKSGDGAVDALDVIVYANGHARPFSTYSGGEQMRISIAQRRALSNLLAHRKGAECPLMILDEPNSLDDAGMAALAQVLEDLAAAEGLTILVVSHDPALRDAFETSIQIEKVDGRSRIAGTTEPIPTVQEATA